MTHLLSRRTAMQLAGAASVLSFNSGVYGALGDPMALPRDFDTADPEHNLIAYMKIMSDLSDPHIAITPVGFYQ